MNNEAKTQRGKDDLSVCQKCGTVLEYSDDQTYCPRCLSKQPVASTDPQLHEGWANAGITVPLAAAPQPDPQEFIDEADERRPEMQAGKQILAGAPSTDPQEWTPEYVMDLVANSKQSGGGFKIIADAYNAALAAEREKPHNKVTDWTVRMGNTTGRVHIEHYFPKGYNPDEEPWKSIKAHHNSALAAAQTAAEEFFRANGTLTQQLAAEREKREKDIDEIGKFHAKVSDRICEHCGNNARYVEKLQERNKTLAEALKVLRGWMKYVRLPCGQYSVASIQKAEAQADAALANAKEGK